jgi:hypothetical protein
MLKLEESVTKIIIADMETICNLRVAPGNLNKTSFDECMLLQMKLLKSHLMIEKLFRERHI